MLVLMKSSIHDFHTDSNAYFLPPKILHYSRPNRNRRHWLCKILGVNKVHYGLFENNKFVPRERMYVCTSVKGGWGGGLKMSYLQPEKCKAYTNCVPSRTQSLADVQKARRLWVQDWLVMNWILHGLTLIVPTVRTLIGYLRSHDI